ncbi:hypothetical protein SAMN06273572_1092 [Monaibacterium marinum]|uniref:Replication initiation factor n=1 Tax=Pontivivens marinum TaxID=1690039 RepID=A0A2C9CVK7_9RHOB|nr:hypothetical protein [Monaibacterium marinum]SOH95243.1 hypothetical protein SAMN06273572_1092 [Monaibacterium marinum]
MDVVHSGFDGLKLSIEADIPPDFREALIDAKTRAAKQNDPVMIEWNGVALAVRKSGGMSAFSAHTGDYGAEWYFLDPLNKPKNNPGITVDFRAFLLATGGIAAARAQFEAQLQAFGIRYGDHMVKVARVDFAVDVLAPWFTPDRSCIVAPSGTRTSARASDIPIEEYGVGDGVTGLKAGQISNRQLAIYDKRREVIDCHKRGWEAIWNSRRAAQGKPPLDLADAPNSRVWRFEMRLGSKQLRNRWLIRGWDELDAKIGDALAEAYTKTRYTLPQADSNRARWPEDPIWQTVREEATAHLSSHRSYADPALVKEANRAAHKLLLDTQILGLLVSRAATEELGTDEFEAFIARHITALRNASRDHPVSIAERLAKAEARYDFK